MPASLRAGRKAVLALLALVLAAPARSPGAPPPAEGDSHRKVLLIGIDGLRSDALLAASAPNLRRLIRQGDFSGDALADRITRSGPGWTSVLTGVWSPKHGVIDNSFEGYRSRSFPHFFRRIKERDPSAYTASLVNWAPIDEKVVTHADLSLAFGDDDSVANRAIRLLAEGDPDATFLHFDAPDYAGHRYGFSRFSPPYLNAVRRTDERVGKVLEALEERPGRGSEEWLILCVTDHGGTLRHHGEDIPACRRIPLIVAGDAAAEGGLDGIGLADVAPTLLAWLGMPADPAWGMDGKPAPLRARAGGRAAAARPRSLQALDGSAGDRLSSQAADLLDEQVR